VPTVVLALAAAALYGLSDFLGGVVSRRTSVWEVAVVTQITALVAIGAAALLGGSRPTTTDWGWGALAGIGTGIGTAFLYRGLAGGRMGVVAPLSAVGAALLPVAVGIVTGERPPLATWIGIALAFPAIWLVSTASEPVDVGGEPHRIGEGAIDGLLAGLGFGLMFSALGQVRDAAGLGPLALGEATSIVAVVVLAAIMRQSWIPADPSAWWGVVVGALAAGATILFLFASQSGLLAVASVLSSLYPAFTVLLAAVVLREPIHRAQSVGLVMALAAVALVAAG
jgi:drug/metabolite transporter (DMT)-like permease